MDSSTTRTSRAPGSGDDGRGKNGTLARPTGPTRARSRYPEPSSSYYLEPRRFTLDDLLMVLAVVGAVAVLVLPTVSRFIGTSTTEASSTQIQAVKTTPDRYGGGK